MWTRDTRTCLYFLQSLGHGYGYKYLLIYVFMYISMCVYKSYTNTCRNTKTHHTSTLNRLNILSYLRDHNKTYRSSGIVSYPSIIDLGAKVVGVSEVYRYHRSTGKSGWLDCSLSIMDTSTKEPYPYWIHMDY